MVCFKDDKQITPPGITKYNINATHIILLNELKMHVIEAEIISKSYISQRIKTMIYNFSKFVT